MVRLLERCRAAAAQNNVELESERPFGHGGLDIEARNQPRPDAFIRYRVENRVKRKYGVARKVHLRDEPRQKRRPEQRKVDMRGAPGIGMIAPGIGAGLDAYETVAPLAVGHRAALAAKIRIERGGMLVAFVNIPARRVRLPYLDQGIRDRAAILIGHAPREDYALAQRLPRMLL